MEQNPMNDQTMPDEPLPTVQANHSVDSGDALPLDSGHPSAASPTAQVRRAVEAIILVATEPVPLDVLSQLLEWPQNEVEQICDELAEEYRARSSGFELALVAGGYRYQTVAEMAPYVERFVLDEQRARLSGAALETLAIVAYKQPISRAQIASIRGVDPDGVLRTLAARGYIGEVGRDDGPGQAVLFGTTPLFCEKLGLSSLEELPPIAEFIPEAAVVEALEAGLRIEPITPSGAGDGT